MATVLKEQIILSVDAYNQAVSTTCVATSIDNTFSLATLIVGVIVMSLIYAVAPTIDWKVAIGLCVFITVMIMGKLKEIAVIDTSLYIYREPRRAANAWCEYGANPINLAPLFDKKSSLFEELYNRTVSRGLRGTTLDDAVVIVVIDALKLLTIEAAYK